MDEERGIKIHTRGSAPPVTVLLRNVTIVFQNVTLQGYTTVARSDPTKYPPYKDNEVMAYVYEIETTAEYIRKNNTIKIVLPSGDEPLKHKKLFRLDGNEWIKLESSYDEEYHSIIGSTDHLSAFGVI